MIRFVSDVLSLDDSTTYADGDVLFDTHKISVMAQPEQTATIKTVIVADEDKQDVAMNLIFLSEEISIGTVNAADTLAAVDAPKIFGIVEVVAGNYVDLTNAGIATKTEVNIPVQGDGNNIYVAGISKGTGNYSTSGVVLKIAVDV